MAGLTLRRTTPRATSLHLTPAGVAALVAYFGLPPMPRPSEYAARGWAASLRSWLPRDTDIPMDLRTSAEELVAFFDDEVTAGSCSDDT